MSTFLIMTMMMQKTSMVNPCSEGSPMMIEAELFWRYDKQSITKNNLTFLSSIFWFITLIFFLFCLMVIGLFSAFKMLFLPWEAKILVMLILLETTHKKHCLDLMVKNIQAHNMLLYITLAGRLPCL